MAHTTDATVSANGADAQTLGAEFTLLQYSMQAARSLLSDSRGLVVTPEELGYLIELFCWRLDMIQELAMAMAHRLPK